MAQRARRIIVVGGGTSGSVMAARLSESPHISVTLLEAGPDDAYDEHQLDPARAAELWGTEAGGPIVSTPMATPTGSIDLHQGRILGGTSAINGLATLRGQPADYDRWAAAGLNGWAWRDVEATFIRAERDVDFGDTSPIHGADGPLPVRRWRRDEMSRAPLAYLDGMAEIGEPVSADINDPNELPGVGVFPVTVDDDLQRVSTSKAYLTPAVRARENLAIRTGAEVDRIEIDGGRAVGVTLATGESIDGDEIVVTAGAIWTPVMLLRSGVGPAAQLADHGIAVHADLPVGETMSDHLGPGIPYMHEGPRGGVAGPAQVVFVGATNGTDVDYHMFPISPPVSDPALFIMGVFLMRSSNAGSVRLADDPYGDPVVTAPPLPDGADATLRHAFDRLAAWERSSAAQALGCTPVTAYDLSSPDAPRHAVEQALITYFHMTGTCPMGPVLDADCRVHGIDGLRVADASVMPTIPVGNTYLGCVMVAERIAAKMADQLTS